MGLPLVIIHFHRTFPSKPSSYLGTHIYGTPISNNDDLPMDEGVPEPWTNNTDGPRIYMAILMGKS